MQDLEGRVAVIKARHRAIENGEDPPTQAGALDGY